MPRIAIATCLELPEPDVDQELVLDAFYQAGLNPILAAWDDDAIDWAQFDAVVIRSTWNYPERPQAFREWVERVDGLTNLLNPARFVVPNIDKRYLFSLQQDGVPIVPTTLIRQSLGSLGEIGSDRIVIKPAIGAGSYLTSFFDRADAAGMIEHIAEIESAGTIALAQPFMESVPHGGERSLVWIDDEITHKIVKQPRFSGGDESVSSSSVPVEPLEREMVKRVISTLPELPLYARVDLIEDAGRFVLNELELIEPSLFFLQNPPAVDKLVDAVRRRL